MDLWEQAEDWALYLHPIIRFKEDPVPTLARGSYGDCEEVFFRAIDDPEIDDFYLELAPAGTWPES